MSLQALWSLYLAHPAGWVNGLALFFSVAGSWLLLATQLRQQRAVARLIAEGEMDEVAIDGPPLGESRQRLNRFFYRFGYACLGLALGLSWVSTRL